MIMQDRRSTTLDDSSGGHEASLLYLDRPT